jgi:hypothetical protein
MRTATPFSTWSRMTERSPSATSGAISSPRFMGPGCITMTSRLARLSSSRVRPNCREYSRSVGNMSAPIRSFWMRSIITTSAPSTASASERQTRTPRASSAPRGIIVAGPVTRTREPNRRSRWALERATRLWAMSPQMATSRFSRRPLARRMVSASSSACVGCSWLPSPALITLEERCRARKCGAPEHQWRMTTMSGFIASMFCSVSSSVSPLDMAEPLTWMLTESEERRFSAISKLRRVRVEFSKKALTIIRPRRVWTFLIRRSETPRIASAVSRMTSTSSRARPSMPSRCLCG